MKASIKLAKKITDLSRNNPGKESQIANGLIEELANKNLSYLLPSVIKHLEEIQKKEVRERTLSVRVSHEGLMDESEARKIAGAPYDAPVELAIDRELLGGSVIRYRGKEIDLSAEAQVQRLSRSLNKNL